MASKVLEDHRFSIALGFYWGWTRTKDKLRLDHGKMLTAGKRRQWFDVDRFVYGLDPPSLALILGVFKPIRNLPR